MTTSTKNLLRWSKRPTDHETSAGHCQRWREKSGRLKIDRYPDTSGRYLLCIRKVRLDGSEWWDLLGRHRKLLAAQKAAAKWAQ